MLLNLSNHPSSKWSDQQLKTAANDYGGVEDLPFPNIPPHYSREDVQRVVQQYFEKVRALNPKAVHLMGEMTFTFALVQKLKAAGWPCVASTTERKILEEKEGKKTLQFTFVQFRSY